MEDISQVATWQLVVAAVVFLFTYAFIITEKVNRAVAALLGALIMIILGIVEVNVAYEHHIQWGTILLLIAMMIIVGIVNKTGVLQYVAIKAAQLSKGDPLRILIVLSLLTAMGSALLDTVTTVLLIVPVIFSITRILRVSPLPYLISQIIACNIGGTATLIGNPPNIMVGTANDHLSFNDYVINLAPIVVLILIISLCVLRMIYAKQLKASDERKQELMKLDAKDYIKDHVLMKKSVAVLLLTMIGFTLHSVLHLEVAVVAMLGATLLMLIGVKERDLRQTFQAVEWVTIFFFAGLFVIVGALFDVGILHYLAEKALEVTAGNMLFTSVLILWISGIASATMDNIPYIAAMIPLIQEMGLQMGISNPEELNPIWWSLVLGACLGGSGTLIGAFANVVVAGMAFREGHRLSYITFLRIGAPLTLLALCIATVYVIFIIV